MFLSKMKKAVFVLFLALLMSSAVIFGRPVCAAASYIWSDNFDDGKTLAEKYQDVSTNGFSVSSDDALSGQYSLKQIYSVKQVDAGWAARVNNDGFPDHVFMSWSHKFEQGFQGFPPKMARIRYRPRSGSNAWQTRFAVHTWIETDGEVVLDVVAPDSTQANDVGWLPIAFSGFTFADPANIGRWVNFEMEVKLNTPGAKDGLYRLWIDGKLVVERTGVDLRGSTNYKWNEAMLDTYWNGGSPKVQSRYYDDFIISTERVGSSGAVSAPKENENLFGADKTTVENISLAEAGEVFSRTTAISLPPVAKNIFDKVIGAIKSAVSDADRARISYFIQSGTKTTQFLGAGERGGAVSSFASAFSRLPQTAADWQDVIKIGNGRWPTQRSAAAEAQAKIKFKKVYLREPNMASVKDNAAVTIMTYGLRPAQRNMASEQQAIRIFKNIYGYNPALARDWDAVRAIAYSGATR
ncbi:MAG: hypothetical protein PHE24_04150 [Patescibacteria group bacterium]|nr:hypothetical protein [Patescibacteria group bacterium]